MCFRFLALAISSLFLIGCGGGHGGHDHYAGQEKREIKALSEEDIENYRAGKGMGFAKVAELNGFPGPMHILENEVKLNLSEEERNEVKASFKRMKEKSVRLGNDLIEKEKELDKLFSESKIDKEILEEKTLEIAKLKGNLRNVHLQAHLEMKNLLSVEQINKYKKLRGYSN